MIICESYMILSESCMILSESCMILSESCMILIESYMILSESCRIDFLFCTRTLTNLNFDSSDLTLSVYLTGLRTTNINTIT